MASRSGREQSAKMTRVNLPLQLTHALFKNFEFSQRNTTASAGMRSLKRLKSMFLCMGEIWIKTPQYIRETAILGGVVGETNWTWPFCSQEIRDGVCSPAPGNQQCCPPSRKEVPRAPPLPR